MGKYDSVIIGGGFYGLRIAQFLVEELDQKKVLIIEKEKDVMTRASYNNQARVHNGYHYPRSVLTALRSRVNLPVFADEYHEAIVKDFDKYYGVATHFSKVTANQFQRFYERIDANIEPAHSSIEDLFDPKLIEKVFKVEEYAFNTAILKKLVLKKLDNLDIQINKFETVESIKKHDGQFEINTNKSTHTSKYVLNTTYSSINKINKNSNIKPIMFKHELTEMCLVHLPEILKGKAFTIMCGPFFSIMPFPDKNLHTLSHVRYTPHSEWHDTNDYVRDSHAYLGQVSRVSHFPQMISDVKRFMPRVGHLIEYAGESLWEIKTVLPQSETDDSRPILYKEHYDGLKNYICIMGGKIDNIYDVFKELKLTYAKNI